jgi:hypothetical protein
MKTAQSCLESAKTSRQFEPRIVDKGTVAAVTAGADSTGEEETGGWYCAVEYIRQKERQ